jgi:hypothetical protein
MQGALFIYPMYVAARDGLKTQTRRFGDKPNWKAGQTLYVKEPVYLTGQIGKPANPAKVVYEKGELKFTGVQYLWDEPAAPNDPELFWILKQKLFCPEKAARVTIRIEDVWQQRLGDMTDADYRAEGLQQHFAAALDDRSSSGKEWRVEMANDLMFSDPDPAKVYAYLLKATAGGKDVYDPDALVWAYRFTWHKR